MNTNNEIYSRLDRKLYFSSLGNVVFYFDEVQTDLDSISSVAMEKKVPRLLFSVSKNS